MDLLDHAMYTTTTFNVIVNGKMSGVFQPERSIWQDSLYFYYICRISSKIYPFYLYSGTSGIGIKLTKGCPKIQYLMFTHNCLIFYIASKKAANLSSVFCTIIVKLQIN